MNTRTILTLVILITFFSSCSSDSNSNPNNPNGSETTFVFENSTFSGNALITYTDGTTTSGNFINGNMSLPISASGQKIIASIQPQNEAFILIGRKEGASIHLNYYNGTLFHRLAIGGVIPIGSYAEFQLINSNNTSLSANYELEADLDFMNLSWIPIGIYSTSNPFKGNFNGNNHEISNLYVNTTSFGGLFGAISANPSGSYIENIIIKSGNVSGVDCVGAIVGYMDDNTDVTIDNCQNYATVKVNSDGSVGGILGFAADNLDFTIINCKNYGDVVSDRSNYTGGIAGRISKVISCQNYGLIQILNDSANVGGIAGFAREVLDCSNSTDISTNGSVGNIGGIVGWLVGGKVNASYNKGNITTSGDVHSGGIAGTIAGLNIELSACYNSGTVANYSGSTYNGTGGIIGSSTGNFTVNLSECYNTGFISGTLQGTNSMNGGIIGKILTENTNLININNCFWKDISSDGAVNAIGRYQLYSGSSVTEISGLNNIGTLQFSSTLWPSASNGWLVGDGTNGAYWKTLGTWNGGNPVYPKLYFEN